MPSRNVRVATAADAAALGIVLPSWCAKWGGWVYPAEGEPVAMGAICWDGKGWAVCFFSACRGVPPVVMHRTATRALRWLRETGARRILTVPDVTKPRAAEWLCRLGFHPTETVIPGYDAVLWECDVK